MRSVKAKVFTLVLSCFCIGFSFENSYAEVSGLVDKTGWYECLARKDCLDHAEKMKSRFREKGYRAVDGLGLGLSLLLAEHLKAGAPLNYGVLMAVENLSNRYSYEKEASLIRALKFVVLKRYSAAKDVIDSTSYDLRQTKTAKIISALADQKIDVGLINRKIPFLIFLKGKNMLEEGNCEKANGLFEILKKRYRNKPELIKSWAESKMDCDLFTGNVLKSLNKSWKKNREDHRLLAQIVRYYNKLEKDEHIEKAVSYLDIDKIKSPEGAEFLSEYSDYKVRAKKYAEAEGLLKRGVKLDPDFPDLYLKLGKLYLNRRDLPKAVANLRQYIRLSPKAKGVERLRLLLNELEENVYD